jgi:hypothetical protein
VNIFVQKAYEFESKTFSRHEVTNNRVGANITLAHEKVQPRFATDRDASPLSLQK